MQLHTKKFFLICCILFLFSFSAALAAPLRVHPTNPRYFTDDTGNAIYMTGAHAWPTLRDMHPPTENFDFPAYLDQTIQYDLNFIRVWAWDLPKYTCNNPIQGRAEPFPWERTGPGNATDGKPKFDLSKLNQAYFDRLRERVELARSRGVYLSIMLFEAFELRFCRSSTDGFPLTGSNNINGIDAGTGTGALTLSNPAVLAVQENYVRKVLDTLNDFDHIVYEIANEGGRESTDWQIHMINFIKTYEAGKPKQHLVGMTFQYPDGDNTTLFNSPADWISPGIPGGSSGDTRYRDNPPANDGSKVIITDTDHLWGVGGSPDWVWKSFLRGLNPIYMDPYHPELWAETDYSMLRAMKQTRRYAKKINLDHMTPQNSLASTGYCLAGCGEYLVFLPSGWGSVDLSGISGTLTVEWFSTSNDSVHSGGTVSGGATRSFSAPFSGAAVLYLKSTSQSCDSSPTRKVNIGSLMNLLLTKG